MALFTRRKHGGRVAAGAQDEDSQSVRRAATIGELLRQTREQYDTSIEQIGAALRIRPVFLQAIEDNQYDRLPGPVYAVGFVRTYADYLGLDGAAIAHRFKSEAAGRSAPRPEPPGRSAGGELARGVRARHGHVPGRAGCDRAIRRPAGDRRTNGPGATTATAAAGRRSERAGASASNSRAASCRS